jgi:hypothetical protein
VADCWYAVTNTRLQLGFGQVWPLDVFPYVIVWSVYHGAPGYPWYRQNYNPAIEPQSSTPEGLAEAAAAGRALRLEGGASLDLTLKTVVFRGAGGVTRIDPDGTIVPREEIK